MAQYKISVIIPVYNAEAFIDKAMDSLLEQTIGFENLQVIMVDDCSTDNSPGIMADYGKRYDNVLLLKTPENSGAAGKPRNIALEHVTAPYVMFLDPDDFFEKTACSILYEKVSATGAQIVGGYCDYVDAKGENAYTRPNIFPAKEKRFSMPDHLTDAMDFCDIICIRIFDAAFLKENQIRFLDAGFGEDTVFIYRCFVQPMEMIYVPHLVYHYRMNADSATHRMTKTFFQQYTDCMKELREILAPHPKACRRLMEGLSVYYFELAIKEERFGKEELMEIFRECSALFDNEIHHHKQLKFAGDLIRQGLIDQAAEYIIVLREQYDLIRAYEGRFSTRIANAVSERRWLDVIRIVVQTVKKKLTC